MTILVEIAVELARRALEDRYRCSAELQYTSSIHLVRPPSLVLEGKIHVFDLTGHPDAIAASVWGSRADTSDAVTIHTVLHIGGILTAVDAVRSLHLT